MPGKIQNIYDGCSIITICQLVELVYPSLENERLDNFSYYLLELQLLMRGWKSLLLDIFLIYAVYPFTIARMDRTQILLIWGY